MNTLIQDLRYAVRMLKRNPGFTAIAVLALALGIGANTAVFAVVNGVLLRPLPFAEQSRLFMVSYRPDHGPLATGPSMVDSHYLKFLAQDPLFDKLATFSGDAVSLTGVGDPVRLQVAPVTLDFFSVLGVNLALGRLFAAQEDQEGRDHVVLLSDQLWRERFHDDAKIVDARITLGGVPYTVVGV